MKYHFIGDQGISMRGLKEYMKSHGHEVSGSDLKTGGHKAENITSDIDVVVRTSAVNPGSPGWVEVEAAQKLGIKVIKRSELLGAVTENKRLIAVSGMHGKTTITAMAGLLLIEAGLDPTVLVGEEVKNFDGVLRLGRSEWFVAEVCEYDKSFLDVRPEIVILTNIEEEHLDTYPGGLPEIKQAFFEYLNNIKDNGAVIACADSGPVREVVAKARNDIKILEYGFNSARYNHLNVEPAIPGKHNVQNALAVIALADYLQIEQSTAERILIEFKGAYRRFEYKGKCNGADVIDDYGHHPSEIKATLEALRERYPDKKKVVVFWPHQFKRIKSLVHEFGGAFNLADELILKPIYFVPGRDEQLDISSDDLAKLVNQSKPSAKVMKSDEEIIRYLKDELDENSVLLTIGIPPVYKIADELIRSG